jgi:hypothetical protein
MQYGVAVQRPVLETGPESIGSLYVFVEALGRYRYDPGVSTGPASTWEMVPGLQWKMADNMWLSGGLLFPVGVPNQSQARLWQLTCSFQF